MMQHKTVLFLVSLSKNKIQEIEDKGVNYRLFLEQVRGYSHVELHENITEELIKTASLYRVVVIVGHQIDGCIEMADGSLFPMAKIPQALPSNYDGYLHVAVCGSSVIFDAIKERCPYSRVRASKRTTQLELQLLIYSLLLSRTDLNKETFDQWYEYCRDYIKESQERKNPDDLTKLPIATKLGEESSKDNATSVFAPKEVKATYTFPIQVFLHFDSEKGYVLAKAKAEGCDPDTMPRLIQEPLTNIHIGDIIDVRLTMLDKDKQPTQGILVFYQEGYFSKSIKICEEETKCSFDVNVTEQYSYEECWAQVSFINANNEKPCLNLDPFKIKITVPLHKSHNISHTDFRPSNTGGLGIMKEKNPIIDVQLEKKSTLNNKDFAQCVIDPQNAKAVIGKLHKLIDNKTEPKDVMMSIRAAMDASVIRKPTWGQFCAEFGRDKIKSKTSFNDYTDKRYIYDYKAFDSLKSMFENLIS